MSGFTPTRSTPYERQDLLHFNKSIRLQRKHNEAFSVVVENLNGTSQYKVSGLGNTLQDNQPRFVKLAVR